ncbi:DUF3237 domain-containing protein [Rhodococcus fascians]|nr:DUF3237 domain-containing protein [Rhodococcus fascians]MBY4140908.1 DUF3237 domain-containing protein [Rhodococcus fascians]MBY4219572.1 DUF3237 domain-containing protein [Rhodococcus fascians]MBY4221881.1 DUF3237 domain-containing protein [Rhodococcus fascians]MBY4233882.1 DUF3237 domain-containing protein [Rhodococcus fascians]
MTAASDDLPSPELEFVFEVRVNVHDEMRIGRSAQEVLHFVPITGGTVQGPKMTGEVLPYGGDWFVERGDTVQLDARYVLRADDGSVIDIHNRGYYRAEPDVEARLQAGELVDERDYYYRTAPVFQTDSEQFRWLADNQFIGMARNDGDQICIRFFLLR